MNLTANVVLDLYAILLLLVLFFYSATGGSSSSRQHQVYLAILLITVFLLIADIIARFDGLEYAFMPACNWWGNLLLFLATPLLPSLWVVYVYLQTKVEGGFPRSVLWTLAALNAGNAALVLATQYTGWFYTIDAANIYHRGPYYILHHMITLAMLVWTYVVTYQHRHIIDKRVRFSLIFFPIPPLLGSLLQALVYSYAFALAGVVPALLVVLLYSQDDSIYTDYLTGVGNRKKLEEVLKEKVTKCSAKRTFAFIMLDIDHFKKINDTLGHEMGDRVLKITADLLKKCVRANDYVTRYGGDEFCLILDVSTLVGLNRVMDRISGALDAFNQTNAQPFKLSFSMGRQVYPFYERPTAEAFLKRVDMLMYEDKRAKAARSGTSAAL